MIDAAIGRASGACGLAACGVARCGVIPYETVGIETTPIIRIYSSAMVWQMQTRLYTSFVPVLNYYEPHTFSMVINPNVIDVSLVQPGGFLSYQTPDMPNPYLFMIESRALTKTPLS